MTSKLRDLSESFNDLEERVFHSSQQPPVDRLAMADRCVVIGFTNPFSFQILSQRPDLVTGVDHWYSDGGLLCRTAGWGRGGHLPRYSFDFSSIAHGVFDHAVQTGTSIALLGGTEDEITTARAYLQTRYPTLDIVWTGNGYFRDGSPDGGRQTALDALARSSAGIIIIGMGTPLQEDVAVDLKRLMMATNDAKQVIFTCGGFLSQTAQGGDYYPDIIKKTGLRWVYRAFHERHVRQRLMRDYPRFVMQVAACRLYRMVAPAPKAP